MIKSFVSCLALVIAALSGCSTSTTNAIHPSTAFIEDQLKNVVDVTTDRGGCTGWVLKGTHEVVTAEHCSEGLADDGTLSVDFGDGTKHAFHIKKRGAGDLVTKPDLMVLYTSSAEGGTINWPSGVPACKFKPYYGEWLVLIGNPLRVRNVVSFGMIGNPEVQLGNSPFSKFIEYDGRLLPGNSGGPAIDVSEQCVIGVAELVQIARGDDGFGSTPYGLNYLTPISQLGDI